jgi:hypothetical protein
MIQPIFPLEDVVHGLYRQAYVKQDLKFGVQVVHPVRQTVVVDLHGEPAVHLWLLQFQSFLDVYIPYVRPVLINRCNHIAAVA